jgi:hypothetical protein
LISSLSDCAPKEKVTGKLPANGKCKAGIFKTGEETGGVVSVDAGVSVFVSAGCDVSTVGVSIGVVCSTEF